MEDGARNAPGDRDTHFFLHIGDNPATGKPRYADKVVVMDDSGRPVTKGLDKEGKPVFVMRYVGPQDAQEGSTLRVVWALPKLYITETTGPTPVAKDIYITHGSKRPSRARGVLEDVEVEEGVDPNEVLAAQNENIKSSAADAAEYAEKRAVSSSGGFGSGFIESNSSNGGASNGVAANSSPHKSHGDEEESEFGRKRKGESSGAGVSKKSKRVVVDEDF